MSRRSAWWAFWWGATTHPAARDTEPFTARTYHPEALEAGYAAYDRVAEETKAAARREYERWRALHNEDVGEG